MLDAIKETLFSIADGITAAIDFLIGFFKDIVYVIELLGKAVVSIPKWLAWLLPPEVMVIAGVALSVIVVLRIVGRDN